MLVLGMSSLFIGILANQFHGKGIRWKILLLSLPGASNQTDWATVSVDSAFFLFLQQEAVFVDTRHREDFQVDHIPDAITLPFFEFFDHTDLFHDRERNAVYILYDLERNSKNVRLMARQLARNGFTRVFVMRGGFVEWLDKKYPVERGG